MVLATWWGWGNLASILLAVALAFVFGYALTFFGVRRLGVDVPTAVTFHVGSRSNRTFTVEAAGPELDYYLLAGTPKEILGTYTELTGKLAHRERLDSAVVCEEDRSLEHAVPGEREARPGVGVGSHWH